MKRNNKAIVGGLTITIILFILFIIYNIASGNLKQQSYNSSNSKLCDAIFERNGEICSFNSTSGAITTIAGEGKYSPSAFN